MTVTNGSSLEHVIGPEGLVSIRLNAGDIRLRAVDGEVFRIRDLDEHDLDGMFEVELGEGSASLATARSSGTVVPGRHGHGPTPDLQVEVPRRATVVVEAGSAEIEADGLAGDQRYRAASGDLRLRSVTGRVAVDVVSGDVDILAVGDSAMSIRTVSGDIELRAATLTALEAATTSGDLRIAGRLAGPGPFSIVTVSGDASLAPDGDVRIEMATVSGDLRSKLAGRPEGGRGRRSLVVGAGGPLVSVRSMSGDLLVLPPARAGASAEAPPDAQPPEAPSTEPSVLGILHAVERGEIDVAEAGRRLEALDRAEPIDPASVTARYTPAETPDA